MAGCRARNCGISSPYRRPFPQRFERSGSDSTPTNAKDVNAREADERTIRHDDATTPYSKPGSVRLSPEINRQILMCEWPFSHWISPYWLFVIVYYP